MKINPSGIAQRMLNKVDVGFLLFSSMLNPTELYLSKEFKHNTSKNKKLGLLRKKTLKQDSIDSEIEIAIEEIITPKEEKIINKLLTEEKFENPAPEAVKYGKPSKASEEKSIFKNLYNTFVSYAKSTYTGIRSAGKKIIEGPVRMTLSKFIKVFEYIQAAINPQWNMPTLSKMDYDTLSPAITNHIVINKENFKYNPGYASLADQD